MVEGTRISLRVGVCGRGTDFKPGLAKGNNFFLPVSWFIVTSDPLCIGSLLIARASFTLRYSVLSSLAMTRAFQ